MDVERPLFADVPLPAATVPYEAYYSRGAFSLEDGVRSVTTVMASGGHFGEDEGFEPAEAAAILALAPGKEWEDGDWWPWHRLRKLVGGTLAGWQFGRPFFTEGTAGDNGDFDGTGPLYEELRTGDAMGPLHRRELSVTRVVDGTYLASRFSPENARLFTCLGDGETWVSEDGETLVRRIR